METKHKPGPWTYESEGELSNGDYQCSIFPKIDNEVDEVAVCWGKSKEEAEANAALMSAAPEVLKSLAELVKAVKTRTSVGHDLIHELIEAEKVIKKATE